MYFIDLGDFKDVASAMLAINACAESCTATYCKRRIMKSVGTASRVMSIDNRKNYFIMVYRPGVNSTIIVEDPEEIKSILSHISTPQDLETVANEYLEVVDKSSPEGNYNRYSSAYLITPNHLGDEVEYSVSIVNTSRYF